MAASNVYRYVCTQLMNRKPCGGEIKPTRHYRPVKHEDEGPDFSRRIRLWKCAKCNHTYEEMVYRQILDPDAHNPSVSEFSQLASKGVVRRIG